MNQKTLFCFYIVKVALNATESLQMYIGKVPNFRVLPSYINTTAYFIGTIDEVSFYKLSYILKNLSSRFPTLSDTNWTVQPQKLATGLKFLISEVGL